MSGRRQRLWHSYVGELELLKINYISLVPMSVHRVHIVPAMPSEARRGCPGVTGGCEPPCGYRSPLLEHPVLLLADPSLQTHT